MKSNADTWDKQLPKAVEKADPKELDGALNQLTQARQDLDKFYEVAKAALDGRIEQVKLRRELTSEGQQPDESAAASPKNNSACEKQSERKDEQADVA